MRALAALIVALLSAPLLADDSYGGLSFGRVNFDTFKINGRGGNITGGTAPSVSLFYGRRLTDWAMVEFEYMGGDVYEADGEKADLLVASLSGAAVLHYHGFYFKTGPELWRTMVRNYGRKNEHNVEYGSGMRYGIGYQLHLLDQVLIRVGYDFHPDMQESKITGLDGIERAYIALALTW